MNHHLAILYPVWIELILDGSKTIESRFSKVRCAPFGKVSTGDTVYLKVSGGPVKGHFTVADVTTFENLTLGNSHILIPATDAKSLLTPNSLNTASVGCNANTRH